MPGSFIGHGQMEEGELEQVMIDFIEHRYDILLATTIIESGLDIPNANTIFIDEANRYGLSELHQLRGRVGRYKHQAYCYLLVDRHKHLSPDAARRLHAIEEYSQIGAGFGIAMRDLEIRGAGNLLGTQQSGHIAAVGYELYCQLLGNAVRELTHQPHQNLSGCRSRFACEGLSTQRLRAGTAAADRHLPATQSYHRRQRVGRYEVRVGGSFWKTAAAGQELARSR